MVSPKIYLAVDNCFASKRWTKPKDWMEIIKSFGVNCVEASADNECDPLYTTPEYLADWVTAIKRCSEETGVKVVNLYSGHGTYATLGLAHTDIRIRDRILNDWLLPIVDLAKELEAGLGFYCHAFSDDILQSNIEFLRSTEDLYDRLSKVAEYGKQQGVAPIGVEQMYTPHQIPWTIEGAAHLIKDVYRRRNSPVYITLDTGHQSGQRKFLRPNKDKIKQLLATYRREGDISGLWLGPKTAYEMFYQAAEKNSHHEDAIISNIEKEMEAHSYLFAQYEDGDPYLWLEKLGCYSPIIHLQQTDGKSSGHKPFTQETNREGIIKGDKILQAIKKAYDTVVEEGMPPKCERLYLTLEIFSGTAEINTDIINKMKVSVEYWRKFIPQDGLTLDELLSQLEFEHSEKSMLQG